MLLALLHLMVRACGDVWQCMLPWPLSADACPLTAQYSSTFPTRQMCFVLRQGIMPNEFSHRVKVRLHTTPALWKAQPTCAGGAAAYGCRIRSCTAQGMVCVFADSGVEPAHRQHAPARGGVPAQAPGWAATVPFVPSTPRRTACLPPLLPTVLRPAGYTRAPRQPQTAMHSCCQTCTVQVMSEQLETQSKDKGKAIKKLQRVRDACKCVERTQMRCQCV